MRHHQRVFYLGCEWEYLERVSTGLLLKSLNKNVGDVVVPFKYEKTVTPLKVRR